MKLIIVNYLLEVDICTIVSYTNIVYDTIYRLLDCWLQNMRIVLNVVFLGSERL